MNGYLSKSLWCIAVKGLTRSWGQARGSGKDGLMETRPQNWGTSLLAGHRKRDSCFTPWSQSHGGGRAGRGVGLGSYEEGVCRRKDYDRRVAPDPVIYKVLNTFRSTALLTK